MARHSDATMKKNAQRGAVTTWCPGCKRKSALSHAAPIRTCRYCGFVWSGKGGEHRRLYEAWEKNAGR